MDAGLRPGPQTRSGRHLSYYMIMQQQKLSAVSRILVFLTAIALTVVLFVPMWRIDLDAPQYPEGLRLQIYPHKLGGNVEIINGLNHYIGMKTLHTEDFIEFTVLPYIIGFFALTSLLVAIIPKRRWLNILFIAFVLFGIIAMVDFWRWEYNYGHNLDPNAAIVVPGMAYQPPLIGFKQLLNFGAYSIPDTGGWLFVASGVLLLLAVWMEWKRSASLKRGSFKLRSIVILCGLAGFGSCQSGPVAIKAGEDPCYYCKMTISDMRYGCELLTTKGKAYKFDDLHCLLAYVHAGAIETKDIRTLYVADFGGDNPLLDMKKAFYLRSEELRSPMRGNIAAFSSMENLKQVQLKYPGNTLTYDDVMKKP